MQRIKEYKGYLMGVLAIIIVGALVSTFGSKSLEFPTYIHLPMMIIMALIMCSIVASIILGFTWMFTKEFTFNRFLKILAVVTFLWSLSAIISIIKN